MQSDEADIIICGGGGAGCVVAARLAEERPDLDILLIEEGGDNRDIPRLAKPLDSLFWLFQDHPYLKWLNSEPQPQLDGRAPRIPVGRILGGGTSVNTLMYNTPAPSDYDDWNQPGWGYKDLKPLIKKTVRFNVPYPRGSTAHGMEGKFEVSQGGHEMGWGNDLHRAFRAIKEDIPLVDSLTDYAPNTSYAVGRHASPSNATSALAHLQAKLIDANGQRSNVADAYLHPSTSKNLRVMQHTTITRVILETGAAKGVEVCHSKDGQQRRVIKARHLVVMCCGAIGTPVVLERSGIGDSRILRKAGIKPMVDLSGVGKELDDHQLFVCCYHASDDLDSFDDYARGEPRVRKEADELWDKTGKGMVATNGYDWGYKLRPDEEDLREIGPLFQKYWSGVGASKPDKTMFSAVIIPFFYAAQPRPPTGKYFSIGGFHNYPASRGSVHATSSDPFAPPRLDVGLLTDLADMPVHVWHYKMYFPMGVVAHSRQREVCRRLPFFRGEHRGSHPVFPSGSAAGIRDDAKPVTDRQRIQYTKEDDRAIETFIRSSVATAYHTMSTCPMRARKDGGVVDARLNVYGVKRLKVADLSMCPSNVGSNTTSVVMLIAERAVEIILEDLEQDQPRARL